ncbi:Csu type fimbrial protein [Rosenbergiella collisarenosi]|uniref:Csu type fimbrial protein n=1 Tax=Rosenbergiella collisarenosi TaxID=1544695 RepID=UPI001F4F3C5D
MSKIAILGYFLFLASASAGTTSDTFQVSAVITSGCEFGTTQASSSGNFGTISFGTMTAIGNNVEVASSVGAGSIVVTCTPGTAITLSLDYGIHGGTAAQRYLSNGSSVLGYQLYQDAAYSNVWGSGSLAYSVSSFPQSTQTYTIYGRLFSMSSLPNKGTYTDTITVTLVY